MIPVSRYCQPAAGVVINKAVHVLICHIISKHWLSFVVELMLSFQFLISLLFISNIACITVCCGVSYKLINEYEWTNVAIMLWSLHWLPVQQWLVYKAALIRYKVVTTSTLSKLNDLLAVHIPTGSTHCSSMSLLIIHYVASDFVRQHFCFVSPTVWNTLSSDVQSRPSLETFKSRLKTHLFNIAFNNPPKLWCCISNVVHASGSVKLAPGTLQIGL